MTDMITAIAYLPGAAAPNRLDTARAAVALAAQAGGQAVAIVAPGAGCDGLDASGVDRIVELAPAAELAENGAVLAAAFTAALAAAGIDAGGAAILLPYGTLEEEVAAGIAEALDGTAFGKCARIELADGGCTVERPAYGGRASVRLRSTAAPFVCLVRPTLAPEVAARAATVNRVEIAVEVAAPPVERIVHEGPRQPPLESARIIVSGGRGLGSAEPFDMLEDIAAEVGGVVACSLPAADAGWRPVSRQIGQSGKFVSPDLYLAIAVSGTSQHMAGIGAAVPIFAVNNDPDSAIWQVSEVGVLSDWQSFLPKLLDALKTA